MEAFVRKIDIGKWKKRNDDEISADAITCCLKTSGDALSLWSVNSESEDEIEKAVVAISTMGKSLDTIDVVVIDKSDIEENGLTLKGTLGETPYSSFRENHCDLYGLTYTTLGQFAKIILNLVRANKNVRYTHGTLKKAVAAAIERNDIDRDTLDPGILKHFR